MPKKYLSELGYRMNDKFAASRIGFGGEVISINYKPPCLMGDTIEKLKERIKKEPHHNGIWFVFKKNEEGGGYSDDPIKYFKIQDGAADIEHDF